MEYTSPIPVSRGLAATSPLAPLIASANGNVLQIHQADTNILQESITTAGPITHLAWSTHNSTYLAAASSPGGNVVVVDANCEVVADIHDGCLEISWLVVSGHGRIIIGYEHAIGVAIFDVLHGTSIAFLPYATRTVRKGLASRILSRCDSFAALLIRDGQFADAIAIVSIFDGSLVGHARAPGGILRIIGLRWLGDALLVWGRREGSVDESVTVVLTTRGELIADRIADTSISNVRAMGYAEATGILAIGCDAGRVRLVDAIRWCVVKEISHVSVETDSRVPPVIFRECRARNGKDSAFEVVTCGDYLEIGRAASVETAQVNSKDVSWVEFSKDGRYLASRYDGAPHVILVWDVLAARLCVVIVLKEAITSSKWSGIGCGGRCRLAFACGGPWVYMWESRGAAAVSIDGGGDFGVRKLAWTNDDSALVLVDGLNARAFVTVFIAD